MSKITANGKEISVLVHNSDYISLTDIARFQNESDPRMVITNWLSSYSTIDFLATWEQLNNPNFKRLEFQSFRSKPGRLVVTPKQWIEKMNAIGITSNFSF